MAKRAAAPQNGASSKFENLTATKLVPPMRTKSAKAASVVASRRGESVRAPQGRRAGRRP